MNFLSKCLSLKEFFVRYKIYMDVKLGSGQFGNVYKCKDTYSGNYYAVKVINIEKNLMGPLNRELKMLFHLKNKKEILKLIDIFISQTHKLAFVVTELANGDLFDLIYDKKFKFNCSDFILPVFKQIVQGTQYCHDLGYIHGDLKLENILYVKNKERYCVKIADFGYCREIKNKCKSAITYGSIHYSSPESFTRKTFFNYYDRKKLDIWALGILLYVLVSKRHPFYYGYEDDRSIKYKILHKDVNINENWNPIIKNILRKTLNKNPRKRITIVKLLEILKNIPQDVL